MYMDLDGSTSTAEEEHTWKQLTEENQSVTIYGYIYKGKQKLSTDVSKANTEYFLASRYIGAEPGNTYWGVKTVSSTGGSIGRGLSFSYRNDLTETFGVRPVVYLKTDIGLEYDENTGYKIKYQT